MVDFLYSIFENLIVCDYFKPARFDSFAPVRKNNNFKFYINGETYFWDICDSLLLAKKEILITDWWLSPQLYLKRPKKDHEYSRLDKVLQKVANQGVKIIIILYREVPNTLCNNSSYVEEYFEKLSDNINVFRHPNKLISFWSHHEKSVIIDQNEVYMGGIDLCYGRYETDNYPLFDEIGENEQFPFIDFSNPRIQDYGDITNWKRPGIDSKKFPRMPWRDIALRGNGNIVKDFLKHFIQYHSFITNKNEDEKGLKDFSLNLKLKNENDIYLNIVDKNGIIIKNKKENYFETIKNKFKNLNYNNNNNNNNQEFNMNDEEAFKSLEIDKEELKNKKTIIVIKDIIKRKIKKDNEIEIKPMLNKMFNILLHKSKENPKKLKFQAQLCRSNSLWGINLSIPEMSIQNAYINIIKDAKEYIYIENQFFISNNAGIPVQNKIVEALIEKIKSKFYLKEKFKLIIFLPLLPGFEGDILEKNGELLRIQLGWELQTLSRGYNSLYGQLRKYIPIEKINEYIKIFGLRKHEINPHTNIPTTEIIYIHSKLLICDDKKLIIGSANINDRSLTGSRDSELSTIIEADDEITQNEIYEFRKKILYSTLHEKIDEINDKEIWNKIDNNCKFNEEFYRTVFGVYPDNEMKNFEDVLKIKNKSSLYKYDELKDKVKGYAIKWPLYFLEEETNLIGKHFDFGLFILPNNVFT